jgi:hypothetical protein
MYGLLAALVVEKGALQAGTWKPGDPTRVEP